MFGSRTKRTSSSGIHRKTATAAFGVFVVTAMGIGITGTASAQTNPTVSLTVNGKTSKVTTSAATVGALLTQQSVRYDNNDLMSPNAGAPINDGLAVDFTRAVQLTIVQGGTKSQHLVTARTVAEARAQLSMAVSSRRTASRFSGFRFQRSSFHTAAGKPLTATDRVHEGSVAVVHNVRVAFPTDTFRVKHASVKNRSKLVRRGSTRVYQQGHNGRKHIVYRKVMVDGNVQSQSVAQSQWQRKPAKRIVRVGSGSNWIGLANCESGGNPNAVNPAGFYGLYQFSLSTWHAVGGKGSPTDYGYWEQTKRAWILFRGSGRSPWPVCGRNL
jgi:uncharacterized protein YabE (DUF348 family)